MRRTFGELHAGMGRSLLELGGTGLACGPYKNSLKAWSWVSSLLSDSRAKTNGGTQQAVLLGRVNPWDLGIGPGKEAGKSS